MRAFLLAAATLLSLHAGTASAFDAPPNDGFVTDGIGLLTQAEEQSLEMDLQQYARDTSNEIAILIAEAIALRA